MTVEERIRREERNGELTIDYFRIGLGLLFSVINVIIVIARYKGKFSVATNVTFVGLVVFMTYGIALFFYLRRRSVIHPAIKYVSAVIDMAMVSLVLFSTRFDESMSAPRPFSSRVPSSISFSSSSDAPLQRALRDLLRGGGGGLLFHRMLLRLSVHVRLVRRCRERHHRERVLPLDNEIFRVLFLFVAGVLVASVRGGTRKCFMRWRNKKRLHARSVSPPSTGPGRSSGPAEHRERNRRKLQEYPGDFSQPGRERGGDQDDGGRERDHRGPNHRKDGERRDHREQDREGREDRFRILEKNIEKMGEIKDKNDNVISGIIALDGDVAQIRDIVKVINGITDQTKVIAFNAALEAASAGETGKRFAVVATETNQLATISPPSPSRSRSASKRSGATAALIITSEEGTDKISRATTSSAIWRTCSGTSCPGGDHLQPGPDHHRRHPAAKQVVGTDIGHHRRNLAGALRFRGRDQDERRERRTSGADFRRSAAHSR